MRGGVLPPALLFAALGLAIACAPRNAWVPSLIALVASLCGFTLLPAPARWPEAIYLACWTSVVATAASVHFVRGPGPRVALALSLNAGLWASAVVALSGTRSDVLKALPCVLIIFPASWLVGRGSAIAVKVVSSWIIAVAVLEAALQWLPVTPGYLPDHLE